MTNKIQSSLTIALTLAVAVLVADRVIEPAQAQDCASAYDLAVLANELTDEVIDCINDRTEIVGMVANGSIDATIVGFCSRR